MTLKRSYLPTTIEKSSLQVCSCHENICPHSTARHLSCIYDNCVLAGVTGAGGGASLGFPGGEEWVIKTGAEEKLRKLGTNTPGFLPCRPL